MRKKKKRVHKDFLPFLNVPGSLHSFPLFALVAPNGQSLGTAKPVFPLLFDLGAQGGMEQPWHQRGLVILTCADIWYLVLDQGL